ncbi:hypothetical protein TRFO_20445 [Tritrichomonas foetus]|uniref:Regulator of chromosome condensation n=1 Tax=Tritrichomonas foetus TaxID=1144522 RepID=A0A1J4KKU4_9EUKA|nr:hypothetical protein TRFO_20445 [Tritrichomonas foetus]|eukprot:OHT10318.1 hypothetical protein TRFO_20445 [Tritrichomonas foetus]
MVKSNKMSRKTTGLFAAGDNSNRQLFTSNIKVASNFVHCDDISVPFYEITQIIAWDDNFAILQANKAILHKAGNNQLVTYKPRETILSIQIHQNRILGLSSNGYLFDITNDTLLFNVQLKSFSASNSFVCGITIHDECFLIHLNNSQHKLLKSDIEHVGCTDTSIFMASNNSLYLYEDENQTKLDFSQKIVSIAASENEAIFLDENGLLYYFNNSNLVRLYNVPIHIVSISSGTQHFAALSSDGRLYTWGFNPSCQLAYGNDRASNDPIFVESGVSMVACGVHNTWIVKNGKNPKIPRGMKIKSEKKKDIVINNAFMHAAEMLM